MRGRVTIVKASGAGVVTISGYRFGDVTVVYETMDDLAIITTPQGIPYLLEPIPLYSYMYLYPLAARSLGTMQQDES